MATRTAKHNELYELYVRGVCAPKINSPEMTEDERGYVKKVQDTVLGELGHRQKYHDAVDAETMLAGQTVFFGDTTREFATGADYDIIPPSKPPPGFEMRGDDSRPPAEYLLHERESQPYRIIYPADPSLDYNKPINPVQDTKIWSKLNPRFKPMCPKNILGETCPGLLVCDKLRVCNNIKDGPHELGDTGTLCRLPKNQHIISTCSSMRTRNYAPCSGKGICHTSRHAFEAERRQLEAEAEPHADWVRWKMNANNPLPSGREA